MNPDDLQSAVNGALREAACDSAMEVLTPVLQVAIRSRDILVDGGWSGEGAEEMAARVVDVLLDPPGGGHA